MAYQLKQARFPVYRDLAGFEFAHSEVNEALVRQLHLGDFMDRAENVVLVGGLGTGKTHLATAIGVQALEPSPKAGAVLLYRRAREPAKRAKGAPATASCQTV